MEDSHGNAGRSAAYRRIQRRKARRRRLMIRRIRFAAAAIAVCALVVFMLVRLVSGIGAIISSAKNSDSDMVIAEVQTDSVQQPTEAPSKPAITIPYPVKSSGYTEITSDKIKSAYVALVDTDKHEVIAGREWNRTIYPASMTKVMTLIVAVENLTSLDNTFTMTTDIVDPLVRENATRAGFDPGEKVNAKDMLYGLILPSGADAAEGLAIMISGSEEKFVELMNDKCRQMGLKSTHFVNTSGLHDSEQYTTLVEMAMIMEYAMKNELCSQVLSTYQYTTAVTPQHPEGILLTSTMFSRMYGDEAEGVQIVAGKTGYTIEAGNCLVSYAVKDNHHYVAVTAGGTNKWHSIFDDIELYGNYLS